MKCISRTQAAFAAGLIVVGAPVMAGVIGFQDLDGSQEIQGVGPTYSAKGYTFAYTPAPNEPFPVGLASMGPSYVYNNGTTALNCNSDNALCTLTRQDHRVFALLAIDLAELNGAGVAPFVTFVGTTRAGGTVTHTFELDNVTGFQRFFFPASFRNLKSVTWQQGDNITNGTHMFDNVTVVQSEFRPTP